MMIRRHSLTKRLGCAWLLLMLGALGPVSAGAQEPLPEAPLPTPHLLNNELPLSDYILLDLAQQIGKPKRAARVAAKPQPPKVVAKAKPAPVKRPATHVATTPTHKAAVVHVSTPHRASVTKTAQAAPPAPVVPSDPFAKRVYELMQCARQRDEEHKKLITAVSKYKSFKHRMVESATDMLNYSILFKGVSPSSEAGDIILSEKAKLKSLASARFLLQKTDDALQLRVVSALMGLATGLGATEQESGKQQVDEASKDLSDLVGEEETAKTVDALRTLAQDSGDNMPRINKPLWSVVELQKRVNSVVLAAADSDPVITEIKTAVHHYNQHKKGVMAAHRVARTTLSAASLTPSFIGPAAQVVLFAYILVSGGTEQEKLLRELYIDKRLASRANLLNEQAHIGLSDYQFALLSKNPVLKVCSEKLLACMTTPESAAKLLAPVESQASTPTSIDH